MYGKQVLITTEEVFKMSTEDKLYRDLQIHLDDQTIGFPSTESGSDIRLLKQIFPSEQAKVAILLTYQYEPLEMIHERASNKGISIEFDFFPKGIPSISCKNLPIILLPTSMLHISNFLFFFTFALYPNSS